MSAASVRITEPYVLTVPDYKVEVSDTNYGPPREIGMEFITDLLV